MRENRGGARRLCARVDAERASGPAMLGKAYEHSLSKARRKSGGVYYTPEPIVDFIVRRTLGPLCEGLSPDRLAGLRVLDPACGAGSFLLGAYEFFLEWYLRLYTEGGGDGALVEAAPGGGARLTAAERERILLEHVHGIDIDAGAVEVTKRALAWKLLGRDPGEGASPDLARNVRRGNALVERGGEGTFDAVIGNPPYHHDAGDECKEALAARFSLGGPQADCYVYFLERGLELLRPGGALGMIVSDSWLKGKHFDALRRSLLSSVSISSLTVFDAPPFADAAIECSILVLRNEPRPGPFDVHRLDPRGRVETINRLSPTDCLARGVVDVHACPRRARVLEAIEAGSEALSRAFRVHRGVHAYRTDGHGRSKFGPGPQTKRDKDERVYHATRKIDDSYLPELKGKHLRRYGHAWDGTFLSYGPWLAEPRSPEFFLQSKLAVRKIIAPRLVCTHLDEPMVLDQSIYVIVPEKPDEGDLKYLLGILASSLAGAYLRRKHSIYDKLYPWFTKEQLARFPVKPAGSEARRARLVDLVDRMLALARRTRPSTPRSTRRCWRFMGSTRRRWRRSGVRGGDARGVEAFSFRLARRYSVFLLFHGAPTLSRHAHHPSGKSASSAMLESMSTIDRRLTTAASGSGAGPVDGWNCQAPSSSS